MQFYSNSKPDLIGPRMRKTVYKIMKKKSNDSTISDKISNMMSSFYNDYIKENKLVTFFIVVIVVFLIYRYYNKKSKDILIDQNITKNKINEEFRASGNNIIDEIINNQTSHLKYDSQPSVDILKSVDNQLVDNQLIDVNYPPDPIRINIPNSNYGSNANTCGLTANNSDDINVVYARNIYPDPKSFINLNIPKYDYNNIYSNPQLSYYSGTFNPYSNNSDNEQSIPNPLGFRTDFNETTGNFLGQMTDANKQNILNYQNIVDSMNANLINSLKLGPKYLNVDSPELEMEPPYATE